MFGWIKNLFASKSHILVSIPVADTFPNEEELNARNRITDALDARGFGEFIGAGGGFNQMDFEYAIADVDLAKQQVAEVIAEHLPGQEYDVTIE